MPTVTGGRPLSRRALITDLGAAGIGLAIVAACGGSSSDDDATSASGTSGTSRSDSTAPNRATDSADTTTVDPGAATTGDGSASDQTVAGTAAADAELAWQQVSFGFVSAYVLVRNGEAAIVDTGTADGAGNLLAGLEMLGSSWSDVAHVVLTHSHGDHVGGLAGVLAERPGATVYAGEADIASIRSSAPLQAVGDGDEVMGLGVVNTPGHTAGSISVFDTGTGLLVAGDAIVGVDGAIGPPDPSFTADIDTAITSLAALAVLEPQIAAFGHGGAPVTTDVTAQLLALAAG